MADFLLRGVPRSILQDAWWLSGFDDDDDDGAYARGPQGGLRMGRPGLPRGVIFLVLILLADWLFYDRAIGLSLAIFAIVLASACWILADAGTGRRGLALRVGILVATVLPVIEQVQAVSLAILAIGLGLSAVLVAGDRWANLGAVVVAVARFTAQVPIAAFRDGHKGIRDLREDLIVDQTARTLWRAWAVPVGVGFGFALLLFGANPVMSHWAGALGQFDIGPEALARRLAFWGIIAVLVWPFLVVAKSAGCLRRPFAAPTNNYGIPAASPAFCINPASIANSLGLFNLIFAVQTGLDLTYLWGGAELPVGISHAAYAHRGAYPLVATALLAGAFALISRPFIDGKPVLRVLLALWIAQNVLLVISAMYRLDLYVDEYWLTYLRIRAAIWMAMVAAGLAMTGWQVWRNKSNLWLLQRNLLMLAAVLYLGAFVNFAQLIAKQNLSRVATHQSMSETDADYICGLGPHAAGAIVEYSRRTGGQLCGGIDRLSLPQIKGWRDWGFRKWRVRGAVSAAIVATERKASPETEGPFEDLDRRR